MSVDYLIKDATLTDIADAIREKNGSTDTYTPAEMATAITAIETGSGGPTADDLTFTGSLSYFNYYGRMGKLIKKYGSQMSFNSVSNLSYGFSGNDTLNPDLSNLTFNLSDGATLGSCFSVNSTTQKLPKFIGGSIKEIGSIFNDTKLETIRDDFFSNTTFNLKSSSNSYSSMFRSCIKLKKLPSWFINMGFNTADFTVSSVYSSFYYSIVAFCYQLNEIIVPLIISPVKLDKNTFIDSFAELWNARKIVFAPSPEGNNELCLWKNQVIDLTKYVGWCRITDSVRGSDKKITNETTYAALKDDELAWTTDIAYSFYNHDAALETLNSLPYTSFPDTSLSNLSNIIKFKGESGSATDGGAINTLTTEEIAQATNRNWTVSYV